MKTLRPYGARLLVALVLTLTAYNAGASSRSEVSATWTLRVPGFNHLNSVTYGNGLFVAVRDSPSGSAIYTSRNGRSWTEQPSPTTKLLRDVAYGNGLFVAVGSEGTILTSRDGVRWMRRTSPTRDWLSGVAYGNGIFVAVGERGTILTSP
uniref:Cell wall binding protein n=1 Tax=Thermus aquaticus TaxID=271 RepID=A0A2U9QI34_THEAQ|nr:hypothetical protein [Thermus aquaticus]AWU47335.1 Cell wall binding protein [Thermus aquaticus]